MSSWHKLCRASDLALDGGEVVVTFANNRTHKVRVAETDKFLWVTAIVARAGALESIEDLSIRTWSRNRLSQLVGFRVDERGRLLAEGWVPRAGLTTNELQSAMRRIAAAADRVEFLYTGRDEE